MVTINQNVNGKRAKEAVKRALLNWYINRGKEKIPERVLLYACQIGTWPQRVEIKSHKTRWGSCSQDGTIRFNWKIIMATITVLDYVIVHELCHLIHPHHSPKFWQKVQTVIPDFMTRRNKLKAYSFHIRCFD